MSNNHFQADITTRNGNDLVNKFKALQSAWNDIVSVHASMIQQQDSAQSGDAVYDPIAVTYGFGGAGTPNDTMAHNAFSEIDSCYGAANAALLQMCARFLV